MVARGILTENMKRVLREQKLGFVATVCPDGTPNLSPKGTTIDWDDDHVVFADLASPRTIENLQNNPNVEINVVDQWVRRGYRFKGTAAVLTEGELYRRIMAFYHERVERADERIRRIVLVRVQQAAPLISPAYDLGLSEDQVRDRWQRHWAALHSSKHASTTGG